ALASWRARGRSASLRASGQWSLFDGGERHRRPSGLDDPSSEPMWVNPVGPRVYWSGMRIRLGLVISRHDSSGHVTALSGVQDRVEQLRFSVVAELGQ